MKLIKNMEQKLNIIYDSRHNEISMEMSFDFFVNMFEI